MVGNRPVFDFSVTAGSTKVSSFGEGSAAVSIPYTIQPGEDANAIVVYYIDSTGALQTVRGAYNSSTKSVNFVTTHFSQYGVGYNKVSFADVRSADWYYASVTFCAARGIRSGTTATTFSPNATVTRGQFVVMLMRAYDLEAASNPATTSQTQGTHTTPIIWQRPRNWALPPGLATTCLHLTSRLPVRRCLLFSTARLTSWENDQQQNAVQLQRRGICRWLCQGCHDCSCQGRRNCWQRRKIGSPGSVLSCADGTGTVQPAVQINHPSIKRTILIGTRRPAAR